MNFDLHLKMLFFLIVMGEVFYLEDLVLVRLEGMQLQFQVS